MFAKMKVRQIILLGNIIAVVLFLIASALIYASARTVGDSIDTTIKDSENFILAVDLERFINEMANAAPGYALLKDKGLLGKYEQAYASFKATAEEAKKIGNPDQQETANRIVALGFEYDRLAREMISLVNNGGTAQRVTEKVREGGSVFTEVKTLVENSHEEGDRVLRDNQVQATNAINVMNTVLGAGIILSACLAIAGAVFVSGRISSAVKASTTSVASAVTEISSTVSQHERTAAGQASSVNETATTVDELGTASKKVAEQADEATAGAKNIMSLSEDGLRTVGQTIEGMTVIKNKSNSIAEQILRLSEQTAQIGSIAVMVTDISGQINMLALNAAVEAVRAGEHGKGFSVIAQEVRKLADQGKKSAERVNTIVAEIQRATNSTIMAAEEGAKTIDEGTRLAQKTEEAFASVSASVSGAFENFRQISLNVAQQAAAIKQVVEAMNSINAGARDTASGIAQTKIGLENIKSSVGKLNDMF